MVTVETSEMGQSDQPLAVAIALTGQADAIGC